MTDNRWDTLQEVLTDSLQIRAAWKEKALEALSSLKAEKVQDDADYAELEEETNGYRIELRDLRAEYRRIQDVLNRETTAYAELDAKLERIKGERDRWKYALKTQAPKLAAAPPERGYFCVDEDCVAWHVLGHTTEGAPK